MLILLACSASGISHGAWIVTGEAKSRGESRSAVFNSEAHQIQLNHEGQSVWMHITHKSGGILKQNDPVKMTVDANPTYILDPGELRAVESLLGKSIFQWQPSTLSFQLWHGSETEGCGYLEELLQGKALDVHYQLAGEQTGRIVASLKGAREAIIK